jgi:hypothetical protein
VLAVFSRKQSFFCGKAVEILQKGLRKFAQSLSRKIGCLRRKNYLPGQGTNFSCPGSKNGIISEILKLIWNFSHLFVPLTFGFR